MLEGRGASEALADVRRTEFARVAAPPARRPEASVVRDTLRGAGATPLAESSSEEVAS